MANTEPLHDLPIPGMSLTAELGGRPWQSPAQYSTVDEAVNYYLKRMSSEEFSRQLEDILELGIPVTDIANTIQMSGVMDGKHSVDVGMLIMPVIMEMMMLIGDSADIKYTTGLEDPNKDLVSDSMLAKIKNELENKKEDTKEEVKKEVKKEVVPEEEPKGLMARKKQ